MGENMVKIATSTKVKNHFPKTACHDPNLGFMIKAKGMKR
jgi:hypothetical protein